MDLPLLAEGYSARPTLRSDLDAVLALITLVDAADLGAPDYTVTDLASDWNDKRVDLTRDSFVVTDLGSHIVGYVLVFEDTPGIEMFLDMYSHPDHRGAGLDAYLIHEGSLRAQRAVDRGRGGMSLLAQAAPDGALGEALLAAGFESRRRFWRMRLHLADLSPPAPPPPEGVRIEVLDIDRDAEAVHEVIEAAFESHWGSHGRSFDDWWQRHADRPDFDPRLWQVAWRGDRVVGALVAREDESLGEGFIAQLGTVASERGRGVGGALLRAAFATFAQRGLDRAVLAVDSENDTGATRLYEREGMHVAFSIIVYAKRLEPRDHPA